MNEFGVGLIVGIAIGAVVMTVTCVIIATPDTVLREAGIERIECCHNTQSNRYEIVWTEGYK